MTYFDSRVPQPYTSKRVEPKSLKKCHKCLDLKDIEEFCKNPRSRDGRNQECRDCKHAYDVARRLARKNLEK